MFTIPSGFIQDRLTYDKVGEDSNRLWLERLPALLAACEERWRIKILPPFPNLSFHYVAPAMRDDGMPVVVKACAPTGEFAQELEALRLFSGHGMARLLASDATDEVMVLERLTPGTPLTSLVPEDDERATSVLASVMRQLWRPAPQKHAFPTLERWMAGFTRLREHFNGGPGPFPPALLEEAERLVPMLLATAPEPVLLHGDLHHDNVLLCGEDWKAIDPKGLVGDPTYEVSVMLYNPFPQLFHRTDVQRILARRVDQLAEELGIERARIRDWGLVQSIISVWWGIEDNGTVWEETLACASMIAAIKPG